MLTPTKHSETQAAKPTATNDSFFGGAGSTPFFQAKLTVNQPGDEHEREADAVADRVMRIHQGGTPIVQRMSLLPVNNIMRKCGTCEEKEKEGVQRKENGGGDASGKAAPTIVSNVLTSGGGQSMDNITRHFMESRFGQDFSQVRIHTDARAAESANAIQARAYTSGQDVVFGKGEYKPESESGKRLLAHELVHVGQQNQSKIHRAINFTNPVPNEKDPVSLAIRNQKLGKTFASFNGHILPDNVQQAGQIVLDSIKPPKMSFPINPSTSQVEAKVDATKYQINISARMETITPPTNGVWQGSCPPLPVPTAREFTHCRRVRQIPVEMRGFGDLYAQVLRHENEHWSDIKRLSNSELKPAHDFLIGITGIGKSPEEAITDWDSKRLDKEQVAVNSFLRKLIQANSVYDSPGGTHHTTAINHTDQTCSKITITP